ncbi:alpha/beta fold hydrolase [Streptomyces sp. NPDC001852]|uniref:alpha/beta fold hydrolase n=1 Tax=Streptomyces sp. NPDC001852 TaxID=3364619 RepID=UPI00368A1D08
MTTPTPTPTSRQVPLRPGITLAVRESGHGTPVLLLHGGPGPDSLTPLAEHLATRHRVLLPVHPGWDDIRRVPELTTVGDLTEAYLELIRQLGAHPAAVVGSSFGGWIAAEMALRDTGQYLDRVVLMNAIGPAVPGHPLSVPGPPTGPGDPSGDSAARPTGDGKNEAPRRVSSPAGLAALRAYTGPTMQDTGLLGRLKHVGRPVLVVWGKDDTVVSPGYGRTYAAAFPDARFVPIAGGGHLPIREQPAATFAAIDGFLDAPAAPNTP